MAQSAPAPDQSDAPTSQFGDVLDVIYSTDGSQRAVVTSRDSGILHVDLEAWDTSDWDCIGSAYWIETGWTSLTDSLDNARKLAREALGLAAG